MLGVVGVVVDVVVAEAAGKVYPGGTVRGFNRLEEPGGGAGLRRTGAGGEGFRDKVGVGGREAPLRIPRGDGNTWGKDPLFGCSEGNRTGPGGRDAGISGDPIGGADTIRGAGSTGGVGPGVG